MFINMKKEVMELKEISAKVQKSQRAYRKVLRAL